MMESNAGFKAKVNECMEAYKNYKVSKPKQRYNLHYNVRTQGIRVSSNNKTVYIPHDRYEELAGITKDRIDRLLKTHNYSLQLSIL